jgi:GTPase SAR1 family protein
LATLYSSEFFQNHSIIHPGLPVVSAIPSRAIFTYIRQCQIMAKKLNHKPKKTEIAARKFRIAGDDVPNDTFYTDEFQTVFCEVRQIAALLAETLQPLSENDPTDTLTNYIRKAKKQSQYSCSKPFKIGLLGDTGDGKSSTLNSLLGMNEVAKTRDLGYAVTTVITEYHHVRPDQEDWAHIEASLMSKREIQTAISEHVQAYRRPYTMDEETKDAMREEYQRAKDRQKIANDTLTAMFYAIKGEELTDQLSRLEVIEITGELDEGPVETVTQELQSWMRDIQWPESDNNSTATCWMSKITGIKPLRRRMAELTADSRWPFIKIIRVYLHTPILGDGLVLVDLPGLSDFNSARVELTQKYILSCHFILYIVKIGRAVSSFGMQSYIDDVIKRTEPLDKSNTPKEIRVAVVCTRTDDINIETAEEELTMVDMKNNLPGGMITKLKADLRRANKIAMKVDKEREYQCLLTTARSKFVELGLQKNFKKKISNLAVIGVSNKWYSYYTNHNCADEKDIQNTMIEASGIPALRKFCYSLMATSKLEQSKQFLNSDITISFTESQVWRQKKDRQLVLDGTKGNLKEEATKRANQTNVTMDKHIRKIQDLWQTDFARMKTRRLHVWHAASRSELAEYKCWAWNSFKGWCFHDGVHTTKKHGMYDWNETLLNVTRTELLAAWKDWMTTLDKNFCEEAIGEILVGHELFICLVHDAIVDESTTDLPELLEDCKEALRRDIDQLFKVLKSDFKYVTV